MCLCLCTPNELTPSEFYRQVGKKKPSNASPSSSLFKGLRHAKPATRLAVVPAVASRLNSPDMNLAENERPLTLGCKLSLTSKRRFIFPFLGGRGAAEFFDWIKLNFNDAFGGEKWVIAAAMGWTNGALKVSVSRLERGNGTLKKKGEK